VNFYGEATSSPLHRGFGTDRLWVRWLLNSPRVEQCISARSAGRAVKVVRDSNDAADVIQCALIYSGQSRPMIGDFGKMSENKCSIEIPRDINSLKEREPKLGVEWREATRAAFLAAIEAGFVVEDFLRIEGEFGTRWFYLLTK